MTKLSKEVRAEMTKNVIGQKVINLEYNEVEDYFIMTFDNGTETCFRFMTDLI